MEEADLWQLVRDVLWQLAFGAGGGRLSPIFLASMLLILLALWLSRRPGQGFWAWAFPARVYRNRSFLVDLQLMATNWMIRLLGFGSILALSPVIALSLQGLIAGTESADGNWPPLLVGLILFAAADFSVYLVHRVFHETPRLWPFHAVHHSAEELNPVTVYRNHPVNDIAAALMRGLSVGVTQGVLLGFLIGRTDIATIVGVNLFYYAFSLAGSNLRHTHVWLSWGPALEHLLISPAQHQIHHSIDPKHFNKNYGEVLALWDWAFGTLYVPDGQESLRFGLADAQGNPVAQPRGSLWAALSEPFRAALAPRRRDDPDSTAKGRTRDGL